MWLLWWDGSEGQPESGLWCRPGLDLWKVSKTGRIYCVWGLLLPEFEDVMTILVVGTGKLKKEPTQVPRGLLTPLPVVTTELPGLLPQA